MDYINIFFFFFFPICFFPPPLNKGHLTIKQKGGNFPYRPHSILDNFFFNLLKVNYNKFTIRLNFLIIPSMFVNFQENQISIAMS